MESNNEIAALRERIADLEQDVATKDLVIRDFCEDETAAEELLKEYDRSDSNGVDTVVDLIRRVLEDRDRLRLRCYIKEKYPI